MSLNVPVYVDSRFPTKLIITLVVVALIAFIIFNIYSRGIVPRLYIIPTTSMIPTLNPGDVVIIRHVDPKQIRVGDIIAFDVVTYSPGKGPYIRIPVIVHRVVDVKIIDGVRYFITKGDNNPSPDPWYVPEGGVLGIAEKLISLGQFGLLLLTPFGKALILLVITLIVVVVSYLYTQLRYRRYVLA